MFMNWSQRMNDGPSPIGPPNIKQIVKEESVFNKKNTELKNIKYLISNQNLVFRFVELICYSVRFLNWIQPAQLDSYEIS